MTATNAAATAPTRATHKGHGRPDRMIYFGRFAKPFDKGARVTVVVMATSISFVNGKGEHLDSVGTATKFWAAPVTTRAASAPLDAATVDPAERAVRAAATRAESAGSDETRECGACGEVKGVRAFPTTKRNAEGVMRRGTQCRACRDAK